MTNTKKLKHDNLNYELKNLSAPEGLKRINSLLNDEPNNVFYIYKQAYYLAKTAKYKEAELAYLRVLESNDDKLKKYTYREISLLYLNNRHPEKSLTYLQNLPNEYVDEYETTYLKGLYEFETGNYSKACEYMLKALQTDNKVVKNLVLTDIFRKFGKSFIIQNYSLLKRSLLDTVKNNKGRSNLESTLSLARLEYNKDNFVDALRYYKQLYNITDDKYRLQALLGICRIYYLRGEDITEYSEFKELEEKSASDSCAFVAKVYAEKGDLERASQILNSASENPRLLLEKAKLQYRKRNFKESLKNLYRVVETSEGVHLKAVSIVRIAQIYLLYKEYDKAIDILEKNKDLLLNESNIDFYQIYAYSCKKLNRDYPYDTSFYSLKQIFNYSMERTYDHIEKHRVEFIPYFDDKVNLKEIVSFAIEKIDIENMIDTGVADEYLIKVEGKRPFYLDVACIHDTKDILTIFPKKNSMFIKTEEEKPKIKRLSAIDKFNQKYNK